MGLYVRKREKQMAQGEKCKAPSTQGRLKSGVVPLSNRCFFGLICLISCICCVVLFCAVCPFSSLHQFLWFLPPFVVLGSCLNPGQQRQRNETAATKAISRGGVGACWSHGLRHGDSGRPHPARPTPQSKDRGGGWGCAGVTSFGTESPPAPTPACLTPPRKVA